MAAMMLNGHARNASSSFSSSVGSGGHASSGSPSREYEIRAALQASLQSLVQFKDQMAKMHRRLDEQESGHKNEISVLQIRVRALEAEVEHMKELREEVNELREMQNAMQERLNKVDALEGIVKRLEAVQQASSDGKPETPIAKTNAEPAAPQVNGYKHAIPPHMGTPSSVGEARSTAPQLPNGHTALPSQGYQNGSQDMSRESSQSSGKRVSFAGDVDDSPSKQPSVNGNDLQAAYDEFDLFEKSLSGSRSGKPAPVNGSGTIGAESMKEAMNQLRELKVSSSTTEGYAVQSSAPGGRPNCVGDEATVALGGTDPAQREVYAKLSHELADLRRYKEEASERERLLKLEIVTLKARSQPMSDTDLIEREASIRQREDLLRTEAERLRKGLIELEQREAVCADHEEELEKRLKVIQKRELRLDEEEGIRDMKRRLPTHDAREAAQWRKQQELSVLKAEYHRRTSELEAAEKDWCEKTGQPYVPIVPVKRE